MAKQHNVSRLIGTQHEVAIAAVAADPPWQVEMRPPSSLKPAKRNARTHNEAQIDLLANSILHFGVIKTFLAGRDGIWRGIVSAAQNRIRGRENSAEFSREFNPSPRDIKSFYNNDLVWLCWQSAPNVSLKLIP